MFSNLTLLHKLFDVIREIVFESGGDGDAWIISPYYADYAREFEEYDKASTHPFITAKYVSENSIQFNNNQEIIAFIGNRISLPSWGGDIVVEIR